MAVFPFYLKAQCIHFAPRFKPLLPNSLLFRMGFLVMLLQFCLGLATFSAMLAFVTQAGPARNVLLVFHLTFEFDATSRASCWNGLRASSSIREGVRIVRHAEHTTCRTASLSQMAFTHIRPYKGGLERDLV